MTSSSESQTLIRTAQDARALAHSAKPLPTSPGSYKGALQDFIDSWVLQNLPTADVVTAFHESLVEYLATADPLYLVRAVKGTVRTQMYETLDGSRFRATDNAPAWWVHSMLVHGGRVALGAMGNVVATMPTHLFQVAATTPPTANAAGWHIAHILSVKDGDTDYLRWGRADVVRRFVRSIHPCNYFPIAKMEWQRWGGNERVIGRFAALYADRYSSVWPAFLTLAGASERDLPRVSGDVEYEYDTNTKGAASPLQPTAGQSVVHAVAFAPLTAVATADRSSSVVEYRATRLSFRRDVIEPLRDADTFRIVTPHGTFEMTRAEFYDVFANVTASRSYRDAGVYHYPTVPHRAEQFSKS